MLGHQMLLGGMLVNSQTALIRRENDDLRMQLQAKNRLIMQLRTRLRYYERQADAPFPVDNKALTQLEAVSNTDPQIIGRKRVVRPQSFEEGVRKVGRKPQTDCETFADVTEQHDRIICE